MGYHTSISWYCCSTSTATRAFFRSMMGSPSECFSNIDQSLRVMFLVPIHGFTDGLGEWDARVVAQFASCLVDAEIEVVAHEFQAREVEQRGLLGTAHFCQLLGPPSHHPGQPQRRRQTRVWQPQ